MLGDQRGRAGPRRDRVQAHLDPPISAISCCVIRRLIDSHGPSQAICSRLRTLVGSEEEALNLLGMWLRRMPSEGRVLDAGCGFQLPIPLNTGHITGIDISRRALERNEHAHEKILGDITSYPLQRSYDVVVCWDVLEHLRDPRAALRNLASALKPGGMMVVGMPELFSAKGLLTRLMPHWLKVWYFRHVMGNPDAGQPGGAPFRTFLRLTPAGVAREAERLGLQTALFVRYRTGVGEALRARSLVARATWRVAALTLRVCGRDPEASDALIVLTYPATYQCASFSKERRSTIRT